MPPEEKIDWNLRVFVTTDENSQTIVPEFVVRAGKNGHAVNICQGASVISYADLCETFGLSHAEAADLEAEIKKLVSKAHTAICGRFAPASVWMGFDIMIEKGTHERELRPVIIEVNGQDSGGMCDYEVIYGAGTITKHLAASIFRRVEQMNRDKSAILSAA